MIHYKQMLAATRLWVFVIYAMSIAWEKLDGVYVFQGVMKKKE